MVEEKGFIMKGTRTIKVLLLVAFAISISVVIRVVKVSIEAVLDAPICEDCAFSQSSESLQAAILNKYPSIDNNGDGQISVDEAGNYVGDIQLNDLSINSEMEGLEYFIQVQNINLENNKLYGPLLSLHTFNNLQTFNVRNNLLEGSLPAIKVDVGLYSLDLAENNFSGSIPESYGNNPNVLSLSLDGNALSGVIPISIVNTSNIQYLDVSNNPNLVGDLYETIQGTTSLLYLDIRMTGMIQAVPIFMQLSGTIQYFLDNVAANLLLDDEQGLQADTTRTKLDQAIKAVNYMVDGFEKSNNLQLIEKANSYLNLKESVYELLNPNMLSISSLATREILDQRKAIVEALPTNSFKIELVNILTTVETQIAMLENDALQQVNQLFEPTMDDLVVDASPTRLNDIRLIVEALPSDSIKQTLLIKLNKASTILGNREALANKIANLYDTQGFIKTTVTRSELDAIITQINQLPSATYKDQQKQRFSAIVQGWEEQIVKQVDAIFVSNKNDIQMLVTSKQISDLETLVGTMYTERSKQILLQSLSLARSILDIRATAQEKVALLFDRDQLAASVTAQVLDDAQLWINKLYASEFKRDLQKQLDYARYLYNQKAPISSASKVTKEQIRKERQVSKDIKTTTEKADTMIDTGVASNYLITLLLLVLLLTSVMMIGTRGKRVIIHYQQKK